MKYLVIVGILILISGCGDQGFLGEWHDAEFTMDIQQMDPVCMLEISIDGDEPFPVFIEDTRGVTDDGTADFVVLSNVAGAAIAVYFEKDHTDFIEVGTFDEYNDLHMDFVFVRD